MLILSGFPLNLAERLIHIWASYGCIASDGNQLEAFILAVCVSVGLNNKKISRHTQVTAYAPHL